MEPRNSQFLLKKNAKAAISSFSKKLTEGVLKNAQNDTKSTKCNYACIVETTTKQTAKNIANCAKNHPPRVGHERGLRILKCIEVGL